MTISSLQIRSKTFHLQILTACVMAGLIAVSSQIAVPMVPVPMTLQSLAVVLAGLIGGWRIGLAAVLLYLAAAGLGAPVLAGGKGGWDALSGPTAGYLAAFPIAAFFCGWMFEKGYASTFLRAFIVAAIAHVIILAMGGGWLWFIKGWSIAWDKGVYPFLAGGVVKSLLATCLGYSILKWGKSH
jgi:biotin transport system substrate-specific component